MPGCTSGAQSRGIDQLPEDAMYVHIDFIQAEIAYRQERVARDFRRGGWFSRERLPKSDAPSVPAVSVLKAEGSGPGRGVGVDASRPGVCVDDAA